MMFESLQWTVSKPKLLTPEMGQRVVSLGAVVRIFVEDRADVLMKDLLGHLRITSRPLVEI